MQDVKRRPGLLCKQLTIAHSPFDKKELSFSELQGLPPKADDEM